MTTPIAQRQRRFPSDHDERGLALKYKLDGKIDAHEAKLIVESARKDGLTTRERQFIKELALDKFSDPVARRIFALALK